jgi:hypothetical protein
MAPLQIRYEQAVYGSFPFWDRGYAILAQSPGCLPEWLTEFRAVCQRYGERPALSSDSRGQFAVRLPSGTWAIVGVNGSGVDNHGRPGALAFHALFVGHRDYRRAGGLPLQLTGAHREDWSADCRSLTSGRWSIPVENPALPGRDGQAGQIAVALSRGWRVAVQASAPINDLARDVWLLLPRSMRLRLSLATWAYGNANQFDLVALPRLAGNVFDASYLDADNLGTRAISFRERRWTDRLPRFSARLGFFDKMRER